MEISKRKMFVLRVASHALLFGMELVGRLPGARYPRFLTLTTRAKRAADRGNHERAANLARELLALAERYPHDWNYGNALHHAHIVLGRVGLARGDIEAARNELLLAGQTPGSPQLNTFRPNMSLAAELLRRGESSAVLEYLHRCGRFWSMGGGDNLAEWTGDVEHGRHPSFGPNLAY